MFRHSALLCALVVALCASAFAAFVTPASADAATRTSAMAKFPATGAAMQTALRTAYAFWGRTPCNGAVAIRWTPLEGDVVAQADWMAFDPADATTFLDCAVNFNEAGDFTARDLCAAAIHEIGHLNGFDHDDVAAQPVMDAYYTGTPAPCAKAMAPFMPVAKKTRKRTTTVSLATARVSITTRR